MPIGWNVTSNVGEDIHSLLSMKQLMQVPYQLLCVIYLQLRMHIITLEEFYSIHVLRIHVPYFLHSVMMSSSAFWLCMCVCMLETCGGRMFNASVQV